MKIFKYFSLDNDTWIPRKSFHASLSCCVVVIKMRRSTKIYILLVSSLCIIVLPSVKCNSWNENFILFKVIYPIRHFWCCLYFWALRMYKIWHLNIHLHAKPLSQYLQSYINVVINNIFSLGKKPFTLKHAQVKCEIHFNQE